MNNLKSGQRHFPKSQRENEKPSTGDTDEAPRIGNRK